MGNGGEPHWKTHVDRHRQSWGYPNSQRKMQRVTCLSIVTRGYFSHSWHTEEDLIIIKCLFLFHTCEHWSCVALKLTTLSLTGSGTQPQRVFVVTVFVQEAVFLFSPQYEVVTVLFRQGNWNVGPFPQAVQLVWAGASAQCFAHTLDRSLVSRCFRSYVPAPGSCSWKLQCSDVRIVWETKDNFFSPIIALCRYGVRLPWKTPSVLTAFRSWLSVKTHYTDIIEMVVEETGFPIYRCAD